MSPRRERISVPPDGKRLIVCDNWPECDCDADCTAVEAPGPLLNTIERLVFVACILVIAGLALWLGGGW